MSYLVAARGRLVVNGEPLEARDGAAIRDTSTIVLKALADAEVVLVDVAP
jgi:redox-sensitive bicupin YhaK (pirin superfamily)